MPTIKDMTVHTALTLRPATAADVGALQRLATLDSQPELTGDVTVAEVAGRLVAALSVTEDRAVADPFERSAAAVELLRARAASTATRPRRRAWRLALSGAG